MVTSDRGDPALLEAMALIAANPSRDHIEEDFQVGGRRRDIAAMINDSAAASAVLGCAERDGEAVVGGVTTSGFINYQIWMLTTAGAVRFPKWLLGEARNMLAEADRRYGHPCSFYQVIPAGYRAGLRFARHLGFKETRRIGREDGPDLAVVERAVPR